MFKVSLVNLSANGQADPGTRLLSEISEAELEILLETFRDIDPLINDEAEPEIIIEGRQGKILVRTDHGKLFLYDARDNTIPSVELTSGQILSQVSGAPVSATPDQSLPISAARTRTPHRGIAITMLVSGLLLNGYTLYSVFYVDSVNKVPSIVLITNTTELASRQGAIVGQYATGNERGDRFIIVGTDGKVRFGEINSRGLKPEASDTYRIGRHDAQLCLSTPQSGVIDVTGPNTLVYFRDVYQRAK